MQDRVFITPESKFSENSHLFLDDEGFIRDTYLEELFADCYYGREYSVPFKNNFQQYFNLLIGFEDKPLPDDFYDNVSSAEAWIASVFGLLYISVPNDAVRAAECEPDAGTHRAFLRTPTAPEQPVYAPTRHHAALAAVVNVYRHRSQLWCAEQFKIRMQRDAGVSLH